MVVMVVMSQLSLSLLSLGRGHHCVVVIMVIGLWLSHRGYCVMVIVVVVVAVIMVMVIVVIGLSGHGCCGCCVMVVVVILL